MYKIQTNIRTCFNLNFKVWLNLDKLGLIYSRTFFNFELNFQKASTNFLAVNGESQSF